MAHVELSLAGPGTPQELREFTPATNLDRWMATVASAEEPTVVVDAHAVILAASAACCALFGLGDPLETVGRVLASRGVLQLIDFTAEGRPLPPTEVERIPPLLAISAGRPARGLMRVRCGPELLRTVDAMATPIWENGRQAGSLTFFAEV